MEEEKIIEDQIEEEITKVKESIEDDQEEN